ncbi:MAG: hypothetical protein K9N46_01685 [Candidatus Marinimicrobia bacterium]|nr:hypothetical protein [Candidatus Neomarinimicrobiota bacterium]MCF7827811.1 hypothetical protein [Candidatus Neomarinimicrobiota bacterium]MCF7879434.1 hypothetical protein [Candidatus Neomarinimicrobiota bacterium]
MVTEKQLSGILNYQPANIPITTLYLSFDEEAKKTNQHKIVLKDLFRYKTEKTYFNNLSESAQESVKRDFEKIQDYISMEYDQDGSGSRSVAIFSCAAEDLWETQKYDMPMETSMVINPHPYLRPFVEAASEYRNYAIILVDRAKARILEVKLGKVIERLHVLEEDMPDQVKEGDFGGTSERRIERHINEHVHRHLKQVAEKALELHQQHDYKWIYVGGRQEIINEFEGMLHSYLKERIEGHLVVEPHAPMEEVLKKANEAAESTRSDYETKLLDRLSDEIGSGQRGISGIPGTLNAQQRGQIETLIVQDNFSTKGWYCPECNHLSVKEQTCPLDGSELRRTPDLIDNLIFNVLKQGASIEMIAGDMGHLDNVGAILRYPIQKTG